MTDTERIAAVLQAASTLNSLHRLQLQPILLALLNAERHRIHEAIVQPCPCCQTGDDEHEDLCVFVADCPETAAERSLVIAAIWNQQGGVT